MSQLGEAVVPIRATLDKLDKDLAGARQKIEGGLKNTATTIAGTLATAGLAFNAIKGAIDAVVGSINELTNAARTQLNAEKQLDQVLRSTGGAVGLTADEIKKMASELQNVTNFGDEVILRGQNLLLTFTKIGKDVFPRATETMLDMSQALGQDLKSSAIQLGKALNDPIRGVGALQRVGVSFTQTQKNMIEEMVRAGDVAGAQTLILDELQAEFGGSARAMADPWIQLGNAIGDVKEALGFALLPLLGALAQSILPAVTQAASDLRPIAEELGQAWGETLAPAIQAVAGPFMDLITAAREAHEGFTNLANSLGLSTEGINLFKIGLLPLVPIGLLLIATFKLVSVALQALNIVFQTVAGAVNIAKQAFGGVNSIGERMNRVGLLLSDSWNRVVAIFRALPEALSTLSEWVSRVTAGWSQLITTMSQTITIPDWLTPGSPTPLELGIRGISTALDRLPDFSDRFNFGAPTFPALAGAGAMGGGGNTTIVNVEEVSATSFGGGDPADEAIRLMIQLLRSRLRSKR